MKTYLFLLPALVLISKLALAQGEIPDELPQRVTAPKDSLGNLTNIKYPMKGVVVRYGLSFPYALSTVHQNDDGNISFRNKGKVIRDEEFLIKYKIPVLLKENLKLLVGHNYSNHQLIFDDDLKNDYILGQLNGKILRNNRFSVYGLWDTKPNQSLNMVVSVAFNGDYDKFINLDNRYRIYRALALYTFVPNHKLEWGFGIYTKYGFRSQYILPIAIINYDFNPRWGLEFVGTSLMLRNRPNEKNLFYYGLEYSSRDFSIDIDYLRENGEFSEEIYQMKWPKLFLQARWERKIFEILWFELTSGIQMNFSPVIAGPMYTRDMELSVNSAAPFIKAGLFITPPQKWLD